MKNFPFITLKSFPNGYSSYSKIKKLITIDNYNSLIKINDDEIYSIAKYLNGKVIENKIFESLKWILYLNPIPDLEIFFLCERNIDKDNFSVIYSRDSLVVPTEDVFGFTLIYIGLLSNIGEGKINIDDKMKEFISIKQLNMSDESRKILNNFLNDLKSIQIERVKKHSNLKMSKGFLIYKLLNDFYLRFNNQDIQIPDHSIEKFGEKVVVSIIGLILKSVLK